MQGRIGAPECQPDAIAARVRPARDPRPGLAVIPFGAVTQAPDEAALAASVADKIIGCLGGVVTWIAVDRAPAMAIRAPMDLQRAGRISGARYVLHGTVEVAQGRARLSVELNEAETGRVLWFDRLICPREEIVTRGLEAAHRIAGAVPPVLVRRELDRLALLNPGALTDHDLALRAYAMILRPERATFPAAAGLLRQAGSLHASARFATVCWHLMAITQGWAGDPAAEARAAVAAAEGLDAADPASLGLRAHVRSVVDRDYAAACAALDRVIDSAPYCGVAWSLKALSLSRMGEGRDAMFHARQATGMTALGPDLAWRDHVAGLACYVAGEFAEAASWARTSSLHHAGLAANARLLAASLAVLGRLDEARRAANRVLAIDPQFRIAAWRRRSFLIADCRERYAQRLRLAGLPE